MQSCDMRKEKLLGLLLLLSCQCSYSQRNDLTRQSAAYLLAAYDSVDKSGRPNSVINPMLLVDGFRVYTRDSSVRISSFIFTFDDQHENIISIPVTGDTLMVLTDSIGYLKRLHPEAIITVENIRGVYEGRKVALPALIYYPRRKS